MGRCLYESSFNELLNIEDECILGILCNNYHGDV